jgi:excisionase family DNA binding protein
MQGELLTTAEAARRIGVAGETIRQWCRLGRIQFVVTPLGKLFPADEVQRIKSERDDAQSAR